MITATLKDDGTVLLEGKQGTTWNFELELYEDEANSVPWDLSTYLARGQYRKNYKTSSPVLIPITCNIMPYDVDTNPNNNKVFVEVLPELSTACAVLSGVFDVEVYSGTDIVERVIEGKLKITPEVTREVV